MRRAHSIHRDVVRGCHDRLTLRDRMQAIEAEIFLLAMP
jgi:hypothetical protein